MSIITPTFKDQEQVPQGNGAGTVQPKIVMAHEPLKNEPWQFGQNQQMPLGTYPPTIQQMPFPSPMQSQVLVEQKVNAVPATPLKIALIGTAPSSRLLAPFNDPSWKIWACSPGNQGSVLPRVDVWFELHKNLLWPEHEAYGRPYIEWLKQLKIPVYMQDQTMVPTAITYPYREMVKEFGGDFFTSSFSWMLAFAMTQGATEIALYGIDMASRNEYILQRPGFYFFRHQAQQRGIKLTAPHESDILQPPGLYGYSDVTPFGRKILARMKELQDRLNGLRQQRDSLINQIVYLEGALEDSDYYQTIWSGAQNNSLPESQG